MTQTGWKTPTIVTQDDRRLLNNGRTCYPYVNLGNIKRNDYTYADTTLRGGCELNHASPIVFCNGYNFKIPDNATINNIKVLVICQQSTDSKNGNHKGQQTSTYKLVKLKTGASTTDTGVGNNLIKTKKWLPYKKWSTESNGTFSETPEGWGVKNINPSIINNSNFGCLVQFTGEYLNTWSTPAIAKIMMNIDYTLPSVPEEITKIKSSSTTKIKINVPNDVLNKLDLNKPNNPIILNIEYKHIGMGGQTPLLICSSKDLLFGDEKLKNYTLPTLSMNSDSSENSYSQELKVYPGTLTGVQTIDIKNNNSYDNITVNEQDKPPINVHVINSNPETYTGITSIEKEKYINGSQRCMILNSNFENNHANKNGGAMYILTEHFGRSNNTYMGNTAENGPNIKWKGENVNE